MDTPNDAPLDAFFKSSIEINPDLPPTVLISCQKISAIRLVNEPAVSNGTN